MAETVKPNYALLISPKTTNAMLLEMKILHNFPHRETLASDMYNNANELVGDSLTNPDGVNWRYVLSVTKAVIKDSRQIKYGLPALALSVSSSVGTLAKNIGLDMHSPEIVYLSTYHFHYILRRRIAENREILNQIDEGVRTYVSEEKKQERLTKIHTEIAIDSTCFERIDKALSEYVESQFPNQDKYLEILRFLMYRAHGQLKNFDPKYIYEYLVRGDIMSASKLLQKYIGNAADEKY